jgi:hypothetical protein
MNTRTSPSLFPAIAALALLPAAARAQDDAVKSEPAPDAATAREMRAVVDGFSMKANAGARGKVTRLPDPIYLFDDPARRFNGGGIWAWEQSGRPVALMTLCLTAPGRGGDWLCEFTALAPGSITGHNAVGPFWFPPSPGAKSVAVPKAPKPADDAAKRLRQMKEIARRFKAHEFTSPTQGTSPERYELRVLPQPVHRYADPASGLVDGALFIIAYGLNPELALQIEARREGSGEPAWVYGLSRISAAEVHVQIDGNDVWVRQVSFGGARDHYTIFGMPRRP